MEKRPHATFDYFPRTDMRSSFHIGAGRVPKRTAIHKRMLPRIVTKLSGGESYQRAKLPGESALVAVSDFRGDLCQREIRGSQKTGSLINTNFLEKPHRAHVHQPAYAQIKLVR